MLGAGQDAPPSAFLVARLSDLGGRVYAQRGPFSLRRNHGAGGAKRNERTGLAMANSYRTPFGIKALFTQ